MKHCLIGLLIFCLGLGHSLAQVKDQQSYIKAYPNFPFVYLNKTQDVNLTVKKGVLKVITHHHEVLLIGKNNLYSARSLKVRTDSFVKVYNLQVQHFILQGEKFKKSKLKTIELVTENGGGSAFYDDDQFYKISFLQAQEGDQIMVDYDTEYAEPRFFGSHYFSDYSPCLRSELNVHYDPQKIQLRSRLFNNQNLPLKNSKDSLKDITTLTWRADSIEPLTEDNMEPGFRHKGSYVLMSILNFKKGESLVPVCGNIENLYAWYEVLTRNVDLIPDQELIALTDSITKPYSTDKEKAAAIFNWVREKISYLAYEDGMNGFIPRDAGTVARQRYGDCKDMGNLLVKMSAQAKLPVYRAWIGTRDIPYQFSEFPAPFCVNHMIAVYLNDKDTIFLDATGKDHSFGTPTSMIQGKEALVGIGPGKFTLAKVPDSNPSFSTISDSVNVKMDANFQLKGEGFYTLRGYDKLRLYSRLEKITYENKLKIMKNELEKGNNKFKLDTIQVLQYNLDQPLVIYYRFSIPDYAVQHDGHTLVNLNLNKDFMDYLTLSKRKYPVDFSYSSTHKLSVHLTLEEGQKVDFLPENTRAENKQISYDLSYKNNLQTIDFTSVLGIKKATIYKPDFEACDKLISKYKKNRSQLTSLTPRK
jgi:hypothetical protein